MIFDATKGDVAICDVAGTVCSGRVAIEWLGGVVASSTASAIRKVVADPIVLFAISHYPNPLRLMVEPAAAVAGKLTTAAADPSPVRSTFVGEAVTGIGTGSMLD
jgi:hypothetical protein